MNKSKSNKYTEEFKSTIKPDWCKNRIHGEWLEFLFGYFDLGEITKGEHDEWMMYF